MLLILSIVCDSLLSSPSFDHEDLDSELESFRKIRGEKFERTQALGHEAKILKIHENVEFGDVLARQKCTGVLRCAQCLSVIWLVETALQNLSNIALAPVQICENEGR